MAIAKLINRGARAATTAGTASDPTDMADAGDITVGNYLIARVAMNNSGTDGAACALTVSDARNGSWTVLGPANQDPGAANAGITAYIAYVQAANAYTDGDDVTLAFSPNCTGWSVIIEEWSGIHPTDPVAVAATTANGASATPSIALTPTAAHQLFYGVLAWEGGLPGYTEDTDTTDGTWATNTQQDATGVDNLGNLTVNGAYKLVTGTSGQTWGPGMSSRDWVQVAVVFRPPSHTETFDKADSTTLGPERTWTETVSNMEVFSNAARNVTAGTGARARCELDLVSTNHWAEISLGTWGVSASIAGASVCCRYAAAADTCYAFGASWFGSPLIALSKVVAGVQTNLAIALDVAVTTNDRLAIQCQDSVITGFINGVQALQVVDTSITTGTRVGISVNRSTTEEVRVAYLDAFYVPVYGLTTPRIRTFGAPSAAAQQASSW